MLGPRSDCVVLVFCLGAAANNNERRSSDPVVEELERITRDSGDADRASPTRPGDLYWEVPLSRMILSRRRRQQQRQQQQQQGSYAGGFWIMLWNDLYISWKESIPIVWESWINLLAESHISTIVVHRLSIGLILGEMLSRQIWIHCQNNLQGWDDSRQQPVWWLIPMFTTIASFSFFLSLLLQLQPSSYFLLLVALVSLAMVECLIPVALSGCMALFWFDVFSAETCLLVLFVVWVAAAVSSSCIRFVLYPSLGHG